MGATLAKVDRTGKVAMFLPRAAITEHPSWEMNTYGHLTFTLPLFDAANSQLAKYDEITVAANGTVVWWGPIVTTTTRLDADTATRTYRCALGEWWFERRFVGKASRTNYAIDPSFEAPPADPDYGAWASTGTITFDPNSSDRAKLGGFSGKIESASAGEDWYAYQDVLAFTATGVGDVLTAVAWFYIEDDGSWLGEAFDNRGLVVIPFVGGVAQPQPEGFFDIPGDTPRGTWLRAEALIRLPPDWTGDIEIRLYAPGGLIYWDAVQLVRMESLSSASSATDATSDQATILEMLCDEAQNAANGKDNLNITTDCPLTGVRRERHYQHADHANILRAMQEFPTLADGCDFWIDWTRIGPCSYVRTFRTGYPHRGTARGFDYALRLVASPATAGGSTLATFEHTDDGDQGATSIVVTGEGDGPDREEAGADDTSVGLVVEDVIAAPASTDIDALAGVAANELAVRLLPDIWSVTVVRPTWIGVVLPGDTLPAHFSIVDVDGGTIEAFTDRVQVVSATGDLDTGAVALTLNRVAA